MTHLYTIPFSHYCEKGRFTLDFAGIPYQEQGALPLFHQFMMRKLPGRKTVPALMNQAGVFYPESDDIANFAIEYGQLPKQFMSILEQDDANILHEAHDQFAIHTRKLAYYFLFNHKKSMMTLCTPFANAAQRFMVGLSFNALKKRMFTYMKVNDAAVKESMDFVEQHISRCDELLTKSPYFYGDAPSILDIEYASFMTVVVMPMWWVNNILQQESPEFISDPYKSWRRQYENTKSYQWTENIYRTLRPATFKNERL